MKIISLLNSKGGVGKTTLAINLSKYIFICKSIKSYNHKNKVLLVDADPQGSIRDWQEAGSQTDIDVIAADRKQTLSSLPSVLSKSEYDYVFIDTPGKVTEVMGAAISISDMCLIPVCPSPYDLWASHDIAELIKTRQSVANDKPDAFYVLNRAIPSAKISKEVGEYLSSSPFGIVGNPVAQRVVYAHSATKGQTVFDFQIKEAWHEIMTLGNCILHKLHC